MKQILILGLLIVLIVLIGCTKEIIIERNNTIYNITYKNITINNTVPCEVCKNCSPCSEYNRDYVLSLIRQLKHYEKQQDKYWNNTECFDDLNNTNKELIECKGELCNEWNSSWC